MAGVMIWETGGLAPAGVGWGPPFKTIAGSGCPAYGVIAEETVQCGSV